MKTIHPFVLAIFAAGACVAAPPAPPSAPAVAAVPDSRQLESALQALSWPQFRSVVEAIPKLRADVDAYGPSGWDFVKSNYKVYPWRKNINRLDDEQKRRLATLIEAARRTP